MWLRLGTRRRFGEERQRRRRRCACGRGKGWRGMRNAGYMGRSWFCAKFRGFWAGTCSNHARRTQSLTARVRMIKFDITIKCTHFSAEQNNKTTENGRENERSVSAMSSNVANHAPATVEISSEIPAELGRPKRKRVPRQLADALNGCLCGSVLDGSLSGVVKCKQAGCETQWVSTCLMGADLPSESQYTSSITYNVEQEPRNWFVRARGKRQRR